MILPNEMTGIDTNILAYARISDSPWHDAAKTFLQGLSHDVDVVISELVPLEFYLLLMIKFFPRRFRPMKRSVNVSTFARTLDGS